MYMRKNENGASPSKLFLVFMLNDADIQEKVKLRCFCESCIGREPGYVTMHSIKQSALHLLMLIGSKTRLLNRVWS